MKGLLVLGVLISLVCIPCVSFAQDGAGQIPTVIFQLRSDGGLSFDAQGRATLEGVVTILRGPRAGSAEALTVPIADFRDVVRARISLVNKVIRTAAGLGLPGVKQRQVLIIPLTGIGFGPGF